MKLIFLVAFLIIIHCACRSFAPGSDYAKAENYVKKTMIPQVDEREQAILERHGIVFGEKRGRLVHVQLPDNIQYVADERDPRHSELLKDGKTLASIFIKDTHYDQFYNINVEDESNAAYEAQQEALLDTFGTESRAFDALLDSYWKYSPWFEQYVCEAYQRCMAAREPLSRRLKQKSWIHVQLPEGIKCEKA